MGGCNLKTIVSIVGIRPDFIRMSNVFRLLDKEFNHIIIHTGQHFDDALSGSFFKELNIRNPDYNLNIGKSGKEHFYQVSELSVKIIELFREKRINPDLILFLGDSNSVLASVPLKKEGYKIGHIEAGMRSGDRRMLEEINRTVCDHCSDYFFVYHPNYKINLIREGINPDSIFVVGNTIVEVCSELSKNICLKESKKSHIILDIHRPENFNSKDRLSWIINYAESCGKRYDIPVFALSFKRMCEKVFEFGIKHKNVSFVPLMGYKDYLQSIRDSLFLISDSGTAQEEPAFVSTKVIVPRDFTERKESVESKCSFMLNKSNEQYSYKFIESDFEGKTDWMGFGDTSHKIASYLKDILQ